MFIAFAFRHEAKRVVIFFLLLHPFTGAINGNLDEILHGAMKLIFYVNKKWDTRPSSILFSSTHPTKISLSRHQYSTENVD